MWFVVLVTGSVLCWDARQSVEKDTFMELRVACLWTPGVTLEPFWNLPCSHVCNLDSCSQTTRKWKSCWRAQVVVLSLFYLRSKFYYSSRVYEIRYNVACLVKAFVKCRTFDSVFVFYCFQVLHIAVKYFGTLMTIILKHHFLQHNPDPLAIKVFFG